MGNWISRPNATATVVSVSLGMVVIDEIHFPCRAPIVDVAGGSGTYATLGSRLFSECGKCRNVGCLVLAGNDFPAAIRDRLQSWNLSLVFKLLPGKSSTRGLLEYEDDTFGPKKFRYTTPPLKLSASDLGDTALLASRMFHLLATPEEVQEQVPEILRLRTLRGIKERPYIVWEPFPGACKTQNRQSHREACKLVDVFSPNHLEMTSLFEDSPIDGFRPKSLEKYAAEFTCSTGSHGPNQGSVVIRAGIHGSLTVTGSEKPLWLPPFYESQSPKVIDPTGAGNTFLGGFMAGWDRFHDVRKASVYGNVAASYALEQIGLPTLKTEGQREFWNGECVFDRLQDYEARINTHKMA